MVIALSLFCALRLILNSIIFCYIQQVVLIVGCHSEVRDCSFHLVYSSDVYLFRYHFFSISSLFAISSSSFRCLYDVTWWDMKLNDLWYNVIWHVMRWYYVILFWCPRSSISYVPYVAFSTLTLSIFLVCNRLISLLLLYSYYQVFQFFSDSGLEMFSTKQPSIQLLASQSIYDQELVKERDHMQDRYVKREIQKVDEMTIYDSEVAITIGSGSRASIKNNFIIPSTASINGTSELTVPLFIPDSLPHSHSHSHSPSHIQSVSAFQLDHLNDMKSNNNFPLKNGRSNMEIPI